MYRPGDEVSFQQNAGSSVIGSIGEGRMCDVWCTFPLLYDDNEIDKKLEVHDGAC
jgi:hypothetical protein